MVFKQQYLKRLIDDRSLRIRLAAEIGIDPQTVDRRLGLRGEKGTNPKKLMSPQSLKFLSGVWQIPEQDLVEPENTEA